MTRPGLGWSPKAAGPLLVGSKVRGRFAALRRPVFSWSTGVSRETLLPSCSGAVVEDREDVPDAFLCPEGHTVGLEHPAWASAGVQLEPSRPLRPGEKRRAPGPLGPLPSCLSPAGLRWTLQGGGGAAQLPGAGTTPGVCVVPAAASGALGLPRKSLAQLVQSCRDLLSTYCMLSSAVIF